MKTLIQNEQQLQKIKSSPGFIAALDQSGGSTPGALRAYGINDDAWSTDDEMFAIVHQMRTRIITSPSFTGDRIKRLVVAFEIKPASVGPEPRHLINDL